MQKYLLSFCLALFSFSFLWASTTALIERTTGSYGGGEFVDMMNSQSISYDVYGTYTGASSLQNLYNNINSYKLIVVGANVGYDATINSIVSNTTNQTTLNNWLSAGGMIFLNSYNDGGGGTAFLNLPGFSMGGTDHSATSYTLVTDDPMFHAPNNTFLSTLLTAYSWESLLSFPTGSTAQTIYIQDGSYIMMASFRWGLGRVVFLGSPLRTDSRWPGLDNIAPGQGELLLENIVTQMYSQTAVPEPTSTVLMMMGLGILALRLNKRK